MNKLNMNGRKPIIAGIEPELMKTDLVWVYLQ